MALPEHTTRPVIVGISGAIGAGKDVIASYLVRRHKFVRLGWSEAVKYEVRERLHGTLTAYVKTVYPNRAERWGLEEIITDLLWRHRDNVTRSLLQEWGTELRRADDPDYWLNAWERLVNGHGSPPRIVVPDTRFPNEAARIRALGGSLVVVERPGHEPVGHASETSLAAWTDWDARFVNSRTIRDLEESVETWVTGILRGAPPA